MTQPQHDTTAARVVQRSALVRAVRAGLEAADASAASSAAARLLPHRLSRRGLGVLLLTASATHALLETMVPFAAAPAGRYLFAAGGALAAALLLTMSRGRSED